MEQPRKKILLKLLIPWLLFLASLAATGYLWFYKVVPLKSQLSQEASQPAQDEVTTIVNEVGKLIVLPDNEVPTVATVTDLSKLAGQPFFANAKIGDKVLIYTQAQKAIFYDPTANKIIELAPFSAGVTNTNATSSKK